MSDDAAKRAFLKAEQAFTISSERILRGVEARVKFDPGPRRPVGSPANFRIPPEPRGQRTFETPDVNAWFERTAFNLHISAFAHYIEAYRDYHRGQPGEIPVAIVLAIDQTVDAQSLGHADAAKDLQAFTQALVEERCDNALRTFQRQPATLKAFQQNPTLVTKRALIASAKPMVLALAEAQLLTNVKTPSLLAITRELDKLHDIGALL